MNGHDVMIPDTVTGLQDLFSQFLIDHENKKHKNSVKGDRGAKDGYGASIKIKYTNERNPQSIFQKIKNAIKLQKEKCNKLSTQPGLIPQKPREERNQRRIKAAKNSC